MLLGTVGPGICPLSFPFQKQVTQERSLVTEDLGDNHRHCGMDIQWHKPPEAQGPRHWNEPTCSGASSGLALSITTQLSLQNS